jgi:diguanylate cyclase (GGDEF)-like protein
MEADVKKIFGQKGAFLFFNILNLPEINEEYGEGFGELCIKVISQSIDNIGAKYNDTYVFKFGNNDFIITFPDRKGLEVSEVASEIKNDFKRSLNDRELGLIEFSSFFLEYDEEINSIEDFYELIFNNASEIGSDKIASRIIIKHIISTFTTIIRNTFSSFKDANALALTDDVSGLSNHRAGKSFVSNLIDEYSSSNKGFSVMFVDGDNLKRYNKISYEAGNQMIKDLSAIISDSIRGEDRVFRWLSGDEFLVVLKGTSKEICSKLAERVRESVEKQTEKFIYPTTISIGVAHYPTDGSCLEEIISKAERANSYAKDIGRNKVVRWEGYMEAKLL